MKGKLVSGFKTISSVLTAETLASIRDRTDKSEEITSENYAEAWHQAGAGYFGVLGKYKHPDTIFLQPALTLSENNEEEVAQESPGDNS
jgi:hypothetical protein